MAGLPILSNLGLSHTIDWDHVDLQEKLHFACGSDTILEMLRPLLAKIEDRAKSYGKHFGRYCHQ